MAGSYFRSGRISTTALAFALAAVPLTADAREERTSAAVLKALTAGTRVTVTHWSGTKTHGEVMEANDCVLVLRAWNEPVQIPIQSIKTVKRHKPKEMNKAPGALSHVARYCENAACDPRDLMYLGAAVVLRAFGAGASPEKVVYRTKRPAVATTCAAAAIL